MYQHRFASEISHHNDPAVALGQALGPVSERLGTGVGAALVLVSGQAGNYKREIADAVATVLSPHSLVVAQVDAVVANMPFDPSGSDFSISKDLKPVTNWVDGQRDQSIRSGEAMAGIMILAGALGEAQPRTAGSKDDGRLRFIPPRVTDSSASAQAILEIPTLGQTWTEGGAVEGVDLLLPVSGGTLVLSEGHRSVGPAFTVTQTDGSKIVALALRPAAEALNEVIDHLTTRERELAIKGIYLGLRASFGEGASELVVHDLEGTTGAGAVVLANGFSGSGISGSGISGSRMPLAGAPDLDLPIRGILVGDTVQFVVRDPHALPVVAMSPSQRFGAVRQSQTRRQTPADQTPAGHAAQLDRAALVVGVARDPRLDYRVASDWGAQTQAGIVVPTAYSPQLRPKSDLQGVTSVLVFD